jgi:pimeloyl-ACP methyl ester carboxylesterase
MMLLLAALTGLALLLAFGAAVTAFLAWRIEARFPPAGAFVEVAGGRLHYVEAGPADGRSERTIVLLHGASSNLADAMISLGRRLSDRYRVIAIDRPGHGWSDRILGRDAALPANQAGLVAEGLRKLGVTDAVVVGHSWAGAVVPNLALDHRDVTGAILLLSGVTHPWPGREISWYYHPATSFLGWLFTRTVTTPAGALLVAPVTKTVFAPQEPPPGYAQAARIALVLRPPVFQANAQDVAGLHDAVTAQSARYPEIRTPAVVIGGDADRIVWTDQHSRSFAREVPGARLIVLPGAGHMPHYTHTDIVLDEIHALAAGTTQASEVGLSSASAGA